MKPFQVKEKENCPSEKLTTSLNAMPGKRMPLKNPGRFINLL